MSEQLKLMCVMAHPDDESLGAGGILARYAAEGVETYLVTATKGEKGWFGEPEEYPGPEALGRLREAELRDAGEVLGLREVCFLDYIDGELAEADAIEAIDKIVSHLRRVRPHVVVTFDPFGSYGHTDHIAICQLATAAIVAAAAGPTDRGQMPHQVSKLYYMVETSHSVEAFERLFGDLAMDVDGQRRYAHPWDDWSVSAIMDVADHWETVWRAISCHRSQIPGYGEIQKLGPEGHKKLWGNVSYYRAMSLVNGGRKVETDLFEGLR